MAVWSSLLSSRVTLGAVAVTAAVVVTAAVFLSKRKPKKYELVGKVTALNCYPIKSCKGITNDVAFCTVSGMRMSNAMDRHFVIVRPNGDFVTQRQLPKMAGIETVCDGQDLVLRADGMPDIRVPLYPKLDRKKVVPCRVWKSQLEAQDCGDEVASWISEYLSEDLRLLVLVPGLEMRQSPTANAISTDKVAFPDESPYHIITEESLANLVSRIEPSPDGQITVKNFRPNIVIQGTKEPWDEDNWSHLRIGNNLKMRVLAPCDRCLLTTVNPSTRDRRSDEEPLKTLRTFRMFPEVSKAPLFGVFAGVDVESTIRIGDPVYAVRK
ncbi:unnamed protein product [Candidula unifasciata]|uniref:MOSC domain-containing protein n=1 Tax=Candidula unifasciata TaxID=100452 RepID=A0A8S3Z966_9EUPU|nr:unnamed protein product [Candidula unifasciata]